MAYISILEANSNFPDLNSKPGSVMAYKLARTALDRDNRQKMTHLAAKVAGFIVNFTNMDEGEEAWPTEERIALECGCSPRAVSDITELLEDLEWVSVSYFFADGSTRKSYKFNWELADKINRQFEEETLPKWIEKKEKEKSNRTSNPKILQVRTRKNFRLEHAKSSGSNMQNLQAIEVRDRSYPQKLEREIPVTSSDDDVKSLVSSSMGCCPPDSVPAGLGDVQDGDFTICVDSAIDLEWEYQTLDTVDLNEPAWLSEVPPPSEADCPPEVEVEADWPKAEEDNPKLSQIRQSKGLTGTFSKLMDELPDVEDYKRDIEDHNLANDQPNNLGTPESRRSFAWFQFTKLKKEGRLPPEEKLINAARCYREYIVKSDQWPCTPAAWLSGERWENLVEDHQSEAA